MDLRGGRMAWNHYLCRTRDGERMVALEPVDAGSWERLLGYKATGSHTFHIASNPPFWDQLEPAQRTLVVCWQNEQTHEEVPVYAGVIGDADYDRDAGTVTIPHEDIWALWERRLAIPQAQATVDDRRIIETVQYRNGFTLENQIRHAIQLGLTGPVYSSEPGEFGAESYMLPMRLPDPETGGTSRVWWTYDFLTVADFLEQVMEEDDAPMIDFVPEWGSGHGLVWRLVVSDSSPDGVALSVTAPGSPVRKFRRLRRGWDWTSELHATGDGQGTETLHRRRWIGDDVSADTVPLARHEALSSVKNSTELVRALRGLYKELRNVTFQDELEVVMDEHINPATLTLGSTVTLRFQGDPVIPDGHYDRVLIGFSPAGVNALKLRLAPIQTEADGITDE